MALALLLSVWGLSKTGYGNVYYSAATRSMTESWHNFFFASWDRGGFITVDKPPVFLWVDAASVWLFGFSSWALLLPSAVAGAVSVGLLWLVIRRYFGVTAATISALVLALTPVAVAVNRLNMTEPFYILALVGAAACTLRSLEGRAWWRWTALAGLLVGVAFNTKMLAAWIPGPALALAIMVGLEGASLTAWRRWLPRLAVLAVAALAVSASWMLVVDVWPESNRPYVGGSTNNTVSNLLLSYNGLDRVELSRLGGGAGSSADGSGGGQPGQTTSGPRRINGGETGVLRLLNEENGGQIAWFLPFALIGGALSLWRWRDQRLLRAAAVLWLGWVLLFGAVFSNLDGIYHPYYTSALAPGVAALVGMGVVAVSQLASRHRAWLIAGVAAALLTLWVQLEVSGRFDDFFTWLPNLMVFGVVAGVVVFATALWERRVPVMAGMVIVAGGLLLMPTAWSAYEATHLPENPLLPQAGQRARDGVNLTGDADTVAFLAAWLEANREADARWDLAVTSAINGASLVVENDLSVMPLGGFSGLDPTLTIDEFAELVAAGQVRYVLATDAYGYFPPIFLAANIDPAFRDEATVSTAAGAEAIIPAVLLACEPEFVPALYDCGDRAAELKAR